MMSERYHEHKLIVADVNIFGRVTYWCEICQKFYKMLGGFCEEVQMPPDHHELLTEDDIPSLKDKNNE